MKKELDEALVAKYPKIFKHRHAPMTHTAMCWGFECDDGWYNIIDALCSNIQHYVDNKRKEYKVTLYQLLKHLAEAAFPIPENMQDNIIPF